LSTVWQINERLEAEIELWKSQIALGNESEKKWETTGTSSVNPDQVRNLSNSCSKKLLTVVKWGEWYQSKAIIRHHRFLAMITNVRLGIEEVATFVAP